MINKLSFLHSNWVWQIGIAAILLILIFVWKEYRKKGRPRFIYRICSAFLAIASLTLIALKPLTSKANKLTQAVVLTKGFYEHQLDSLKKTNKKLVIFEYLENETLFNSQNVPEAVVVIGEGLKPFDLWQLKNIPTAYLSGNAPKGITRLQYSNKNSVGNPVQINGLYTNPTNGHKLILEGPGGIALDSISITNNTRNFRLTADLNTPGKFLFNLVEKDSSYKIISKDPLPIIVEVQNQLKILIINRNPTFETKYLKNYLAKNGQQVLVRSQLTKAKYKFEYFNMSQKPLIAFTQKNLEPFDLVIIDASTIRTLSRRTINIIKNTIKENGLGLLIQPDNSFYTQKQNISNFNFNREKLTVVTLESWPKSKFSKYPFYFKSDFALQSIHESNSKTLVGYHRLGEGRVGATTLHNTFELLLNGQTKAYNYLWAEIVKSISKKESPVNSWHSDAHFGFINEPNYFKLRSIIENPIVRTSQDYNIPLKRDIDIKSLWSGVSYPYQTGWQNYSVTQDTTNTFQYYVTDNAHWKALTSQRISNENEKFFNNNPVIGIKKTTSKKLINPIWFYLIFILSMGYLWIEPKL